MDARIVIIGGPKTGKTTISRQFPCLVRHTDDLIATHGWSEASQEIVSWLLTPGPWVIEGVAAVRALRKYLAQHPGSKPCAEILYLTRPHQALNKGQTSMHKSCATVFKEIEPQLKDLGVKIEII